VIALNVHNQDIEAAKEGTEALVKAIESRLHNHKGIELWMALKGLLITKKQAEAVWEKLSTANKIALLCYIGENSVFLKVDRWWIIQKQKELKKDVKDKRIKIKLSERMILTGIENKMWR